ncbi:hypothetical protein DINM_001829 [Dirofilaria immitis]|nr:hypothetical protein [Dirofilaria immitis]
MSQFFNSFFISNYSNDSSCVHDQICIHDDDDDDDDRCHDVVYDDEDDGYHDDDRCRDGAYDDDRCRGPIPMVHANSTIRKLPYPIFSPKILSGMKQKLYSISS